jgi:hypothetical protein
VLALVATAPRDLGPAPDPTATPAPTLTPEDARILTEPGAVIRMPALDADGQFGTITIERGEERASYPGYMPMGAAIFEEVFFIELRVTYEPTRAAGDAYGSVDFGYAIDAGGDGLTDDDPHTQWVGVDVEGQPLATGPDPLLPAVPPGDRAVTGWLVAEIPASDADQDLYLVQLGPEDPVTGRRSPVASALLREPAEPVGVTTFDPSALPAPPSDQPMPSWHVLPTPPPSPEPTFAASADAEADALFEETRTCVNPELGLTVTFPASWYANETGTEFTPVCSMFGPEPIDMSQFQEQFVTAELPPVVFRTHSEPPNFGLELPQFERLPLHERVIWRVTFTDDQMSYGTRYLVPLGDDPYAPLVSVESAEEDDRVAEQLDAIMQRMVLLLEFDE